MAAGQEVQLLEAYLPLLEHAVRAALGPSSAVHRCLLAPPRRGDVFRPAACCAVLHVTACKQEPLRSSAHAFYVRPATAGGLCGTGVRVALAGGKPLQEAEAAALGSAVRAWWRAYAPAVDQLPRRAAARTALLKEGLVAAVWHPRRVAAWLEAGVELDDL